MEKRRSVRTYDGRPLSAEDRAWLEERCAQATNPYGVEVRFHFLEPKEHGLKSPVLHGETLYLAGVVDQVAHFEEAYGYEFESVIMDAWERGIGTVWIAGTMNREAFQAACQLQDGELMPCVTPVGYPADKMSVRETVMRKGIKADKRYETGELFFDGAYGEALDMSGVDEVLAAALEEVRWAPSAVNKQPWRVVINGQQACFYEKPDPGFVSEDTGDKQRIDVGIALYHFVHALEQSGKTPQVSDADPGLETPDDVSYVATVAW